MSRIPQKSPSRPTTSRLHVPGQQQIRKSPSRQLRSPTGPPRKTPSVSRSQSPEKKPSDVESSAPKPSLSIREAIALKRAEAAKAKAAQGRGAVDSEGLATQLGHNLDMNGGDTNDDLLYSGRLSIVETVERARSTGNLNISSRELVCIPSCLFDVHLGLKPGPLKLVSEPESYSKAPAQDESSRQSKTSWFEAQDLEVLKARNNEIVEIQSEISLFGSLKVIDLHSNALQSIPSSLATLSSLEFLDLSSNKLTDIPPALFSLPALTTLDISHNNVTSLPFSKFNAQITPFAMSSTGFFSPEIHRANAPLPELRTLNASYNKLTSLKIEANSTPTNIETLILSYNPLACSSEFISSLAKLSKLKELRLDHADVGDDAFKDPSSVTKFPRLQLLDLGETKVTTESIRSFFAGSDRETGLAFYITTSDPKEGELRVIVGKRVIKESWEIEAEQRAQIKRGGSHGAAATSFGSPSEYTPEEIDKEFWEIEAEQGLLTERGRKRAQLTDAIIAQKLSSQQKTKSPVQSPRSSPVIEKEPWELEAEQGLLTEGGRRRARAQAASKGSNSSVEDKSQASSPTAAQSSLSSPTYYSESTQTLTLPPSAVLAIRGHSRAVSLAVTSKMGGNTTEDLIVPTPTLPLDVISTQPFAATLRVLVLKGRKANRVFTLPSLTTLSSPTSGTSLLPNLEELELEGCLLDDTIPTRQESPETTKKVNTIELIAELFPSLSNLNLSYNYFTSNALTPSVISTLLIPSEGSSTTPRRKGLMNLQLRGNKITGLEAFEGVSSFFKGNRQVEGWRFEELDVRDNDIGKLPPLMGLMPMDVFLVDGNTFRIPARKVWEREGTKGLLAWLRGRID